MDLLLLDRALEKLFVVLMQRDFDLQVLQLKNKIIIKVLSGLLFGRLVFINKDDASWLLLGLDTLFLILSCIGQFFTAGALCIMGCFL